MSAGEALPSQIGQDWKSITGVDILDGVGSTEMLHIFLSNKPDDIVYGTGNNNDNPSTTVTPSQYFGEKRTNEPSSSSYIRFGLPYGISSINEDKKEFHMVFSCILEQFLK